MYYKLKKKISEKNIKGLVLTLRPDNAQKLLLDKHLNDTRFIYNQYVEEYLKAIKENRFHIYAVGHVTGAAKVLLKTQWGEPDDNTSISGKICDRLDAIGAVKNLKPWWHLW